MNETRKRSRGRPALDDAVITMVRLPRALVEAMDACLRPGEKRSELIRSAIAAEVERREVGKAKG